MKAFMDINQIPGAVMAFSINGTNVWTEGFGYTDIENNVSTHKDSVWRLFSISKSVTSALVGQLMDRHLIDLNAEIHKYLSKDFYPFKTFNGSAVNITVREVMSHTAGLHMSVFPEDFDKYLIRRADNSDIIDELVSYEGSWPAGGIISTADDMLRFANAMLSAYHGNDQDFLSQKTVQELWTPETIGKIKPDWMGDNEYAKGWGVIHYPDDLPYPYKTLIWHNGGMSGVSTHLTIFPKENLVGLVFTNRGEVQYLDHLIKYVAQNFQPFL
ncbi:unnamed protein product [Oppiella nova]|uniref:Beta-lactamase-related domain-containing protein n=1 Tax=Oppiella nova TaxID=334625 RepID=A0A7R9MBW1_9ACAR|nr:unnamed protein product [Oppiella nova]CAG2174528.1 unnamed protein product [Oppiella nova]